MKVIMQTSRLQIEPLTQKDWRDLAEIFTDFENSEYCIYDFPLPTEENAIKELAAQWEAAQKYFSVRLMESGESIGYICYHGTDVPDVGYAFKKRYQRMGYAYEAVKAWMEASPFEKFTAGVALGNTPSVRLLNKLGFRLVKTEKVAFRKDERGNDLTCDGGIFEYRKENMRQFH